MTCKVLKYGAPAVVLLFAAIQIVRPDRTNPPVDPSGTFEAVAKPAPEVAAIVKRSCSDCHSNGTVWPWYSGVAPASWLVAADVKQGRAHLNFLEWSFYSPDMSRKRLQEACGEVRAGDMPPWNYLLMHPEARLTDRDVEVLCGAATSSRIWPGMAVPPGVSPVRANPQTGHL